MIDTNALRKKILELAIQGKLTQGYREDPFNRAITQKNCPHEGGGSGFGEAKDERGLIYLSAEELYNQIQAEKQRLIAEGKIKKEKPLPPIKEEEIPFEIPRTWKWVRLGEVTNYAASKKKVKQQNVDDNTWSLDLEDIEKNTGKVLIYVKAKERKILAEKVVFDKGNILYSKLRPYLKKILVADKPGVCSSEIVPFSSYGNFINAHFLVYFLMSPQVDYSINSVTYGIKMPRVGTETMTNLLLPLPPLAEQHRIVEVIEKSFKELSIIDEMQKSLSTDAVSFKKKILELAIQGKLVEQRLEDGNAEELYCQILAEKQRLIAEGKLKKEKPLPPIKEEEIPFEIPRTWKWCYLSDLSKYIGDGIHGTPSYEDNGEFYFINGNNLVDGKIILKPNTKRVNKSEFLKYSKPLTKNTILLSINGTIGNVAFYNEEPIILGKSAAYITLLSKQLKFYINLILKSTYFMDYSIKKATQVTITNVSLKAIRELPIPLPPLTEQQRIVAKIEQLFAIADKLINK